MNITEIQTKYGILYWVSADRWWTNSDPARTQEILRAAGKLEETGPAPCLGTMGRPLY